jgi:hypothetical protein
MWGLGCSIYSSLSWMLLFTMQKADTDLLWLQWLKIVTEQSVNTGQQLLAHERPRLQQKMPFMPRTPLVRLRKCDSNFKIKHSLIRPDSGSHGSMVTAGWMGQYHPSLHLPLDSGENPDELLQVIRGSTQPCDSPGPREKLLISWLHPPL